MANIKTDLLVVGGSLAGMAAAIKAKEGNPELDVTIVEKYTAGYAGKANRGAGIFCILGDSDPEDYVKYQTNYIGEYLNDQDQLRGYAASLNDCVQDLDKWSGGKIGKNEDGSFKTLKWLAQITGEDENGKRTFDEPDHFPWTLVCVDLDYMPNVRRYAAKAGIKFVDRVGVVDVLKDNERIAGAVGYHIDTEEQYVFEAKAVVLATGSQNYRVMPMWSPGRGEGLAAAYRAGAEFRNCEFGSFYNWTSLDNFESSMGVEFALYNDKGENVGLPHCQGEHPDIDSLSIAECYKQTMAGNGPMHYRQMENPLMPYLTSVLASNSYFDRPYADDFWGRLFFNAFSQQTSDVIVPGLIGEFSGLKVGHDFQTTIPGLFAAGDICYGGSATAGAVPPPPGRVRGSGLAFAQYSGRVAGVEAGKYAATAFFGTINEEELKENEKRFRAPLEAKGPKAMEFIPEIHKVVQPLGNSLYKKEDRLNAAIDRIEELKKAAKEVRADDAHTLFEVNEINAMLICAELFFRASLLRKESRGWFLREDYPEKANELKWYVMQNVDGQMTSKEEDVPIDGYAYKPEQEVEA